MCLYQSSDGNGKLYHLQSWLTVCARTSEISAPSELLLEVR